MKAVGFPFSCKKTLARTADGIASQYYITFDDLRVSKCQNINDFQYLPNVMIEQLIYNSLVAHHDHNKL